MFTHQEAGKCIAVCFSYHRNDEKLLIDLARQLTMLRQQARIAIWYAGQNKGGDLTEQEIHVHLLQAQIILLLISPDYLDDEKCCSQMLLAMQRQQASLAYAIPVILRPTSAWEQTALGALEPVPSGGRAITKWINRDEAFKDAADGINNTVEIVQKKLYGQQEGLFLTEQDIPPPHEHSTLLQRTELIHDIYGKLLKADTSSIVLTGLGGIGKSTVASQVYYYAEEQRLAGNALFNRPAIWLNIKPTMTFYALVSKIAQITCQLLDGFTHAYPEELAQKLFHLLNKGNAHQLLVLDGFETWLQEQNGRVKPEHTGVRVWLDLLNDHSCTNRILITSRMMPQGTHVRKQMYMQEYLLDGLTQEEGGTLLQMWGIQASARDITKAVELCKGHPLALLFLDKILNRRQIKLATFLDERAYKQQWVNNVARSLFGDLYEPLDELQRLCLQAFAVYRKAVPWRAVYILLKSKRQTTEERFLEATDILLALDLLKIENMYQEEYYRLHPLIAEFVRDHFSTDKMIHGNFNSYKAHEKAAAYYQQYAKAEHTVLHRYHEVASMSIEAVWHYCQARQYQIAYTLLQQGQLFLELMRQGECMVLLELYKFFLDTEAWQPEDKIAAHLYEEMGEIYDYLGAKSEAENAFVKAWELALVAGLQDLEVKVLNNLGTIYRAYSWAEQALSCYQNAMQISSEMQQPVEQGITLNNMGRVFQEMGRAEVNAIRRKKLYHKALTYYKKALNVHKRTQDKVEEARTRNNLGEVFTRLNALEEAEFYYKAALERFQHLGHKRDEGIVYNNLGALYRKSEKYIEAFDYYVRALHICQQIGARWDEASVLRNLGYLFLFLLRNEVALACFLLANKIYEEIHQSKRGTISKGLQRILGGKRSFEQMKIEIFPNAENILEEVIKTGIE